MLKRTFCHIPSIGVVSEAEIWSAGATKWEEFAGTSPAISTNKRANVLASLAESFTRFKTRDLSYFDRRLPSSESWRLFGAFSTTRVAYLDIETTGLTRSQDYITCLSIYNGAEILYFVHGRNLADFITEIKNYDLIVTFNGKCFDLPFLKSYFNIKLDHAHIDLRFVLKGLGLTGGLKKIEKTLGIDRGAIDGIDGYFAVLLWQDYQSNRNEKALETLLAYNMEDTVNLERLMHIAYRMKLHETPFVDAYNVPIPPTPALPFKADLDTVNRIKKDLYS